jgi:hypothetical protein
MKERNKEKYKDGSGLEKQERQSAINSITLHGPDTSK